MIPERPPPPRMSVIGPADDPVPGLKRLLSSAVFIAWPKGKKGSPLKWKHLTLAHMTPEYLARLKAGNIGVALGAVSNAVCAIDIDSDQLVEPFLNANPVLADTFQTHGARGRVFWIRVKGQCPIATIKLKTLTGESAGEFRSTGSQSIVWGIHPDTKRPYQWVMQKPVVEIELDSINWPECFITPTFAFAETDLQSDSHRDTFTEDVLQKQLCRVGVTEQSVTESSEVMGDCLCPSVCEGGAGTIKNREDVLRVCVPTKVHENNTLLFQLARGVLNLERLEGCTYSLAQRLALFTEWYKRSLPFLRSGFGRDSYLAEFMNAKKHAKTPLGGNTIDEAWNLAQSEPLPPEAEMFEEERNQRLVGLCFQLQRLNGDQPFFLSSRDCQRLLRFKTTHEAAKWLTALQEMVIIKLVEKGGARRATRYRYVPVVRKSPVPPPSKKIIPNT